MSWQVGICAQERRKAGWQPPVSRHAARQVPGRNGRWVPRQAARMEFPLAGLARAFTLELAALMGVGFFLGRAVLLGEIAPFGSAFGAAAVFVHGPRGWLALAACLAGEATVLQGTNLAGSMLATIGAAIILRLLPGEAKQARLALPPVVAAMSVATKITLLAFAGPTLYGYVAVLFEAALAAALAYILVNALATRGHPLAGEEFFCLLVLVAGLVAGTGELRWSIVSLKGVLSRAFVLLAALVGGGGLGAAGGAVMGIIPGVSGAGVPATIGVYSFAGFAAGLLRRFGKVGVMLGFILGNILLALYIKDYHNLAGVLAETGLAVALAAAVPGRWLERLQGLLPAGALGAEIGEKKVKDVVRQRMRGWARMFAELSRTFAEVSTSTPESDEDKTLQELLHEIGERICSGCALYRACWERDFYRTYQDFLGALAYVEQRGSVTPENFPQHLRKRCLRLKEMCVALTCLYETYRVNRYWYRRLQESREIVAEHLRGVATIMENLSDELVQTADCAERLDEALRRRLKHLDIPVTSIDIAPREDGRLEIVVKRPPCRGEMACRYIIAPLVSKVVRQPFSVVETDCPREGETGDCTFKLHPAHRYQVTVGSAGAAKGGDPVSGDSFTCLQLKDGRFVIILSDGMGAGARAALESNTTVSLLEHMFGSGFGQDLAIKTVNAILLLRKPDESFATVDITVIDLYSGRAEFVKIGAAPSFLLRGAGVQVIRANSLPVGIVRDIEVTSVVKHLAPQDTVVMVTDGVLECYPGVDKEAWLARLLQELPQGEPRHLATLVLEKAREAAGGAIPDDMTVLVARFARAGN
ncbi:MAG: Phosphoprotein phosphatase [Clostridia bacterium 62_21]|nr:MAG: Phosphoprotein phosphatase [Clostridia bacterium 62_21]